MKTKIKKAILIFLTILGLFFCYRACNNTTIEPTENKVDTVSVIKAMPDSTHSKIDSTTKTK